MAIFHFCRHSRDGHQRPYIHEINKQIIFYIFPLVSIAIVWGYGVNHKDVQKNPIAFLIALRRNKIIKYVSWTFWHARQETAQGNLLLLCDQNLVTSRRQLLRKICLAHRQTIDLFFFFFTFKFLKQLLNMNLGLTKPALHAVWRIMKSQGNCLNWSYEVFTLAAALYTCLMYHRS